ncbi:short-chain dehydrogenase/reductase family protein [Cavenderia fasciculata]|uniref:Short-chain dehydrogenase/reductase family protein n=1 Tax=Cavenderia fasciculata TaxID=261658 RepID=F4Q2K1_CACFS|nr:short-chain dehydrogenase/reductase family protein [Cavenderia fasciculata]EGG16680.1 short-chain dehydrogenase/reductase family protein [Cavenderia fasciculata]|eukprot:XP_004355154.1 short-chain dehydrogenase/reductase family protein [Cavenderia fasciculata]
MTGPYCCSSSHLKLYQKIERRMSDKRVWYITGGSTGFGYVLTRLLLRQGDCVAVTTRNSQSLKEKIQNDHQTTLLSPITDDIINNQLLIVEVDLGNEASVASSVSQTIQQFGRLDVVVNNAGYLHIGSVEETSDDEYRKIFDINFFGMLNVLRATLPHLREYTKSSRYGSRVYNISSIAGILNLSAGSSPYSATKFAMEAVSESLYLEMKPLGVYVTCVKPGYFLTSLKSSTCVTKTKDDAPPSVYSNVQEAINNIPNWEFPGDPEKAMNILIDISKQPSPPLHLFLGSETIDLFNSKTQSIQNDLETYKHFTISTNFNNNTINPINNNNKQNS